MTGGAGSDVVTYGGNYAEYSVALLADGTVRVTNLSNQSEVDLLTGVESLQFADKVIKVETIYSGGDEIQVNTQTSDSQIAALSR